MSFYIISDAAKIEDRRMMSERERGREESGPIFYPVICIMLTTVW